MEGEGVVRLSVSSSASGKRSGHPDTVRTCSLESGHGNFKRQWVQSDDLLKWAITVRSILRFL